MSTEPNAARSQQRPLVITLALTGGFLIAEVIGGLISGSLALLADAGHMLTDVGGLALALFAIRFAARPATPDRTYGYYRAEILAALANEVVLIGISLYILFECAAAPRSRRHPLRLSDRASHGADRGPGLGAVRNASVVQNRMPMPARTWWVRSGCPRPSTARVTSLANSCL